MGVKFYTDSWLTASAGVGLFRALKEAGYKTQSFVKDNAVELPEEVFEKIADIYAQYLLKDFTQEEFVRILEGKGKKKEEKGEKKGINIYNTVVSQIKDFFSNNPVLVNSQALPIKQLNQKIADIVRKQGENSYDDVVKEIKNFINEQFNQLLREKRSEKICFFCKERKAYMKEGKVKVFDATNFTPLAASLETVENFFYNGRSNMYLCPECEIFLYFSAFGFTRTLRGTYLFVYTPDLKRTYELNNLISEEGSISIISRTIVEAAKRTEERKAEWVLKNIYIVEIEKVGNAQANIYTLNITRRLAQAIKEMIEDYPRDFDKLFDLFIEYSYSGKSLYEFLMKIMSGFFFKERYKNLKGREAILIRNGLRWRSKEFLPYSLNYFIKFQEVLNMEEKEKVNRQVNWAYSEGLALRNLYLQSMEKDRASKKIEGISYRILDAVRRRDTDAFQQNLIRAYLEVEREIPYIFVEALKDGSFNRIAYAFLIGLNGKAGEENVSGNGGSEG